MADRHKPNQNTATNPVAQWQTQKQEEFEKDHPIFSPLKALGGAVEKGLQGLAQTTGDFLAFGEDILLSPIEYLAGLEPGTISDNAIFNQWANKIHENGEEINAKHAENVAAGGNTGKFIYNMGAATVQAAPQAVMAMLTGGTSLATTAGLQATANTALSPGVVATVKDVVGNMARDSQYWLAFSQNVGNSYHNAVEMLEDKSLSDVISGRGEAMSRGEIQTKAALYALGTGLMNAAVERSGGLQTLPEELQYGDDIWKLIVNSGVSEGKEETLQGVLDRAMQNLMLGTNYKPVSFSDKDAVFSLPAAAEEFGTGAFVGGLLSGGQALAHGVMNPVQIAADGTTNVFVGNATIQGQQGTLSGKLDGLTVAERQMVDDLLNIGNDVEIIPRSNIQRDKTPDFLVDGVKTELKTLNGTSINTPISKIQKGFKQGAEVVIIDGRYTEISLENAERILERAAGTYGGKFPGMVEFWTKEGIIRR